MTRRDLAASLTLVVPVTRCPQHGNDSAAPDEAPPADAAPRAVDAAGHRA